MSIARNIWLGLLASPMETIGQPSVRASPTTEMREMRKSVGLTPFRASQDVQHSSPEVTIVQ
jgi:hypothetical protein